MSIAVAVKVTDGFAIAADSASTLGDDQGNVANIYNSANKVVNLYKGLPIGMMMWDSGAIGTASTATVAKDLRRLLEHGDPTDTSWKLDPDAYTMDEVAEKVRRYFYDVRYLQANNIGAAGPFPSIGMYVCGFGTTDDLGREFSISIQKDGQCPPPVEMMPGTLSNLLAFASPDPVFRLVAGISMEAVEIFKADGMPEPDAVAKWQDLAGKLNANFVLPAMPIQDAIELVDFLVRTAVMYYRFRPGHNIVGGPVEVAAITKHEGFKWIDRKLYYRAELNP